MLKNNINLIIIFILAFFFFLIMSFTSIVFLKKNNEHLGITSIVEKQFNNSEIIYSSAINLDYKNYILEKFKLVKPDILILGSSRTQYYPQYLFQKRLLIAQQPFYSFDMFHSSLTELVKIHKPKLLIVGIDWWLFNKNYNEKQAKIFDKTLKVSRNSKIRNNKKFYNYSFNEIIKPYFWIINNKISLKYFIKTILSESSQNIGVMANVYKSGYDINGYFVDDFSISGIKKYDLKFQDTIKQIKENKKDFSKFEFDTNSLEIYKRIKEIALQNNIKFISIMHPLSPSVYTQLVKDNYLKNFDLISKNLDFDKNFFNLTNKNYFNDCQFIDGTHSGEVLNFINLQKISDSKNFLKNFLSPKINEDDIAKNIQRVTFKNQSKIGKRENDFLALGCKK